MKRAAHTIALFIALILVACRTPPPATPSSLLAQGALTQRLVHADKPTPVDARLVIEAEKTESRGRPPVNLALVVDTSGSMEGRAIEDARAASKALLSSLQRDDRIAVVTFGSETEVLLPSTVVHKADLKSLLTRIDGMKAYGTTEMARGLDAGLKEVREHFIPEGVNRIILLGDGEPNHPLPVRNLAATAGAQAISITALGLGPDYNETLMGSIAQLSGGRFHYVADSTKVASFFADEIVRLNRIYAKNVNVTLVAGPGVEITGVVGQPAGIRTFGIGDLSFGEHRDLVVKLVAPGHRDGAMVELMDAVIRYEDARTGQVVERRVFFGAHATASDKDFEAGRDKAVVEAVAKVEAAAATLAAIEEARKGAVENAQKSVKKNSQGTSYEFNDDQALGGDLAKALPAVSPAAQGKPVMKNDAEVVRRAHDRAMQVLQGH